MSANSRPTNINRLLSAATASAIPTLSKPAALFPNAPKPTSKRPIPQNEATTLPKPASLCPNVPESASALEILQYEATDFSFSQLPRSIRASYPKTGAEVRQYVKSLQAKSPAHPANPPKSRAQMCSNVPECASATPLRQNKAKSHSDTPAPQPPTLPPRQLQAARLLIAGHTTKSAAAHLRVNPHTVSRWKKHPAFQQEIARLLANPRALKT